MDYQKTGNSLQVTGIGASALHMVGYLGKDSTSVEVSPDESCPVCKKKGLKQALRQYRINFEESIFLCENPQCIYPLGFEPLNKIILPIHSKKYPSQDTSRKRKLFDTGLVTFPTAPCLKLSKASTLKDTEQTLSSDLAPQRNEDHPYETHSKQIDRSSANQQNFNNTTESMEQTMDLEVAVQESSLTTFPVQTQLLPDSSVSEMQPQDNKSLPEPLCLQWKNMYALCWLDCILSALVHLETLKMNLSGSVSENSPIIQRLLVEYNQASALVHSCQRGEHVSGIPLDVQSRAESHLNEIRNIIFLQLQPQLKCKLAHGCASGSPEWFHFGDSKEPVTPSTLQKGWNKEGQEESPVFAFPLLLKKDPQVENLFLHSFSWKFDCSQCGHQISERCKKTLTSFTNITPEWHPLNAVHMAPCNKCSHKSLRKMVLEKVPSVLMIHFVEGLAHSDLTTYSFNFQEDSYQVTAVIQYQEAAKHFIAWILNSDGTWLECDDLKGSYCSRHKNCEIPPSEVHIIIWERKTSHMTNDLMLQSQTEHGINVPLLKAQPHSPGKSVENKAIDNTPLVCHREDMECAPKNETQNVLSNNKDNFLWDFKNLTDDDVITLTLVPVDVGNEPLEERKIMEGHPEAETCTLQKQGPGVTGVPQATSEKEATEKEGMLLGNGSAPLQGQSKNASTPFIMPTVHPSNSSLPETLSVPEAEIKGNSTKVQNLEQETLLNTISRTSSSMQEIPNTVEPLKNIPVSSQVCAPSVSNASSLTCHMNGTKPRVGSWVKGLLGKHPFMPKSALSSNKTESSTQPLKKETSQSLIKGANYFHGFQAKCSNQNKKVANRSPDLLEKFPPPSPAVSLCANLPVKKHTVCRSDGAVTKSEDLLTSVDKQIHSKQNHKENKNFKGVTQDQDSQADRAHQLRLKLQELNAKKKKLDKLAKIQRRNRSSPKKSVKNCSHLESQNQNESLQSLLKEMQQQIGVESESSLNTNMSQCSSSSYDDILSELLSPATTVASLETPQEEECRYLEMGSNSPNLPVNSEKFNDAQAKNHDHTYHSPSKRNVYEDHMVNTSPVNKPCTENPSKQDILEDLLPNSTMVDIEDLDYFDDSLLFL